MSHIELKEIFTKAGLKAEVIAAEGKTKEEQGEIDQIQQAVNEYMRKLETAHQITKHSTLRFDKKTAKQAEFVLMNKSHIR